MTGGKVIGDGGGVPPPMSDLAGVDGASLLCDDPGRFWVWFRADFNGDVAMSS